MSQKVKFHKGPVWYVVHFGRWKNWGSERNCLYQVTKRAIGSVGRKTEQPDTPNSQSQELCSTRVLPSSSSDLHIFPSKMHLILIKTSDSIKPYIRVSILCFRLILPLGLDLVYVDFPLFSAQAHLIVTLEARLT